MNYRERKAKRAKGTPSEGALSKYGRKKRDTQPVRKPRVVVKITPEGNAEFDVPSDISALSATTQIIAKGTTEKARHWLLGGVASTVNQTGARLRKYGLNKKAISPDIEGVDIDVLDTRTQETLPPNPPIDIPSPGLGTFAAGLFGLAREGTLRLITKGSGTEINVFDGNDRSRSRESGAPYIDTIGIEDINNDSFRVGRRMSDGTSSVIIVRVDSNEYYTLEADIKEVAARKGYSLNGILDVLLRDGRIII